jgi:glycosyltransferase involved in cell wall biosynthesis
MKISVALCTYNGEKFISEQIDSILNQTLPVDEIVICDDGSNDKTIRILNKYADENPNLFKIYINQINLKSVKNFEKAIQLCKGDIIFLSDQDDIWVTNKVEDYISYFNNNHNINVIASNGYCLNGKSEVIDKYSLWDVPEFLKQKNITVDYFKLITCIENIATGASMAFRKEIISEVIPFPTIENIHHDEWITLIAAKKNQFELLNTKYFYYRIHNDQQVGGVFYPKSNHTRQLLTEIFNIEDQNISFESFKKRIKKLGNAYQRNNKVSSKNNLLNNLEDIEYQYKTTKLSMSKKYKIKFFVLNLFDSILNKRQLKK